MYFGAKSIIALAIMKNIEKITPDDFLHQIEEINNRLGIMSEKLDNLDTLVQKISESSTILDSARDYLEAIHLILEENTKRKR